MESQLLTVNSPRESPWISKRKNVSFSQVSGFDGQQVAGGAKQSEVFGFVGAISTVIATFVFLVWAYTPEEWLHWLGITYYPSKYWALAIPSYVMVAVVSIIGTYLASNFMMTMPPTSFNTIFDDYSREPSCHEALHVDSERPIDPISDIRIDHINDLMFGKE